MAGTASTSPAQIAKGALRRLAQAQQEPTPENYARAYVEESGKEGADLPERARIHVERLVARAVDDAGLRAKLGAALIEGFTSGAWNDADRAWEKVAERPTAWAAILDRLASGLERGGRRWTTARKKESLQRVLDGSRMDAARLQQRLGALMQAWETDADPSDEPLTDFSQLDGDEPVAPVEASTAQVQAAQPVWPAVAEAFQMTVMASLPASEPRAAEIADALGPLADRLVREGADAPTVQAIEDLCAQARRWLSHRHGLFDSLATLCHELSSGLAELAEDESWARGQCESLSERLADGVNARAVRAASALLAETRERQRRVRSERNAARDALKEFIQRLLGELGELGSHTERFEDSVERHARAIEQADSLEGLAGVVRELVADSRAVQSIVRSTQERLTADHTQALALADKVRDLEGELRRLSEEVSTDALTQVANRRGLAQAFDAECARMVRDEGALLSIGLLDIDNFKKLNDSLGHAAGDNALRMLAQTVRDRLRPVDTVARFGGEEFVVLLPGSPVHEGQQALTRLQRSLSSSLFMHEGKEVFVTFSAGVTQWRRDEAIDVALERADEALYEAKRTGKNRTCVV